MPSRASYSYIPRDQRGGMGDTTENVMDVEDAADRKAIIMAAQLSRIVCRKLEVEAYSYLQRALNEWSSFSSTEMLRFARELGHVLLTLRWRVSWWELLGNGGAVPDPKGREAFAYRVNELCRVLYFYYRMICAKLLGSSAGKELYGVWSTYPDTSLPVFESFPSEDSIEGFARWMLEGQQLIVNAGVEGKLAGIGLRHQRLAENRTSGS